jgi:exodeoxyribonuclease VII small subunit
MTNKTQSLDEAYQELQRLVADFEQGKLGLEESLEKYKRGLELVKLIKHKLNSIENQILEIKSEFEQENPQNEPSDSQSNL